MHSAVRHYAVRHYAVRHYAVRHYAVRHYAVRHYAVRHYAECGVLFIIMLSAIMKSVWLLGLAAKICKGLTR